MRKLFACLVAALIVSTASTPAMARTANAVLGAPGDATRTFECPPGKMLAGFQGKAGLWIDSIQAICAVANSDRTFRQPVVEGPELGGRGGTPQTVYCPVGTVLSRVNGKATRNSQIAWLGLNCQTTAGRQSAGELNFGNQNYQGASDFIVARGKGWSFDASGALDHSCPAGELPTGFTVNFGAHVNAFGLICDRIAYPAAQVVAAPPTPVNPIRKTGRAPSSAPQLASADSFRGIWNTVTNADGQFSLEIRQHGTFAGRANENISFSGKFTNSQGASQYNGTLFGMVNSTTRVFTYEYEQPGISGKGRGTFTLSADGESFTGSGSHNGTDAFTWNGTRVP